MSPERKAVIVAASTAIFLTILKLITGILTGSLSVLTSAFDSALDFIVSFMNYFAVRTSEREADETHNYGHGKIEGVSALFESMFIFLSSVLFIYFAVHKIMDGEILSNVNESIYVMILVIIITLILVRYLRRIARETKSLIIAADALHYQSDLYTNLGVVLALILIQIFHLTILDPIVSIIVAVVIMIGAVEIFRKGLDMLMDRSFPPNDIERIRSIIMSFPEIASYHFLKTRTSGKTCFIEFHIVFRDEKILLRDAHNVHDAVELSLLEAFSNVTVTIHLDFFDDSLLLDHTTISSSR